MERIAPFDAQHLEAACRVLADTSRGLTGPQIGHILQDMNITDMSPQMTKWKRLFNALAEAQNKHQLGNHLIMFINRAMNPVSYARDRNAFEWRRDEINVVLAFSGYCVRDDGKVARSSKESTLKGARARAGRMRAALEGRNVHGEVLNYCRAELIEENYFHAVLEATNTSSVPGDAVAQIYIHQRYGTASRPVRQLKGFERIALQPGEAKTLTFPLGKEELKYWNPQTKEWIVEPSEFDVWAGADSTASLHADLTVTR